MPAVSHIIPVALNRFVVVDGLLTLSLLLLHTLTYQPWRAYLAESTLHPSQPDSREESDMQGYVHTINRRRGLVAIATDGHGYTIIEVLGSELISIGDQVEWDDNSLDREIFTNLTKGIQINVKVHGHGIPETRVRQKLRL
jgi:hypothetical protein